MGAARATRRSTWPSCWVPPASSCWASTIAWWPVLMEGAAPITVGPGRARSRPRPKPGTRGSSKRARSAPTCRLASRYSTPPRAPRSMPSRSSIWNRCCHDAARLPPHPPPLGGPFRRLPRRPVRRRLRRLRGLARRTAPARRRAGHLEPCRRLGRGRRHVRGGRRHGTGGRERPCPDPWCCRRVAGDRRPQRRRQLPGRRAGALGRLRRDPRPWSSGGRHILVCGQRGIGSGAHAVPPAGSTMPAPACAP